MRLELRASHTERRVEVHPPHRRVWPKNHLNVVIEVYCKVDLAGITVGMTTYLPKVGVPLRGTTAGRTQQIPRHIQNTGAGGSQEHFEYGPSIFFPTVGERIGPNTLNGQLIGAIQKVFEASQQRWVCALRDED